MACILINHIHISLAIDVAIPRSYRVTVSVCSLLGPLWLKCFYLAAFPLLCSPVESFAGRRRKYNKQVELNMSIMKSDTGINTGRPDTGVTASQLGNLHSSSSSSGSSRSSSSSSSSSLWTGIEGVASQ